MQVFGWWTLKTKFKILRASLVPFLSHFLINWGPQETERHYRVTWWTLHMDGDRYLVWEGERVWNILTEIKTFHKSREMTTFHQGGQYHTGIGTGQYVLYRYRNTNVWYRFKYRVYQSVQNFFCCCNFWIFVRAKW